MGVIIYSFNSNISPKTSYGMLEYDIVICVVVKQGCQAHFHQGPHQPGSCLQRAECNFRAV